MPRRPVRGLLSRFLKVKWMNLCGTWRGFAFTWANISIGFQTDDGLTKMSWTFFSDLRPVNGRVNWVLVPWGRPIAPHGPGHSLGTFLSVKTIQVEISNEGFVCIDRHQVPSVPCRLLLCWSYLGLLELGKSHQTFPGYFLSSLNRSEAWLRISWLFV